MSNILHSSGGATPGLIKKHIIYQTRVIHYYGEGRHGAGTKVVGHLRSDTNYSGRGTWSGGDTRWTCSDGPFTFPHELICIVSVSFSGNDGGYYNGYYDFTFAGGGVVSIRERHEGIEEPVEGNITIVAAGY